MKTYQINTHQKKTIALDTPGEYVVELVGEGAEVSITGFFQAKNLDQQKISVIIHHKAPQTLANTVLKGTAEDAALLSFTGRIIIDKNCGQSNSFLTERILLLSEKARAEAVPDLEILSDDVSCSHAASISHIPEEQVFYLMSRGIGRKKAEEMIVEGFLR